MATPTYYLTFGLVTIPVKSYVAARDVEAPLKNLHEPCAKEGKPATLKWQKTCSICQQPAEESSIVKGYPVSKEQYLLFLPEELDALEVDKTKTMEIKGFFHFKEIDPVYLGKSDFLGPADEAAAKAFALLHEVLVESGRGAIVQYVGNGKEKLGVIRAVEQALMLHECFYADEVRTYAQQNRVEVRPVKLSKEELKLAAMLMEQNLVKFKPEAYVDGYRARLNESIEAKLIHAEPPKFVARPAPSIIPNLIDSLKRSIAAREVATKRKAEVRAKTKKFLKKAKRSA